MGPPDEITDTADQAYTDRLERLGGAAWKRWLNVQAPYRWNVRRMNLGYTLDIGCGIGRNLLHLEGRGVGVDHNPSSVAVCRQRGLVAYETGEFLRSELAKPGTFDSLLISHLLEHLPGDDATALLQSYVPFLKPGGRVALITPQERGFARDASHVAFVTFRELSELATRASLQVEKSYSFPFPRPFGRIFPYNEFVLIARKGGSDPNRA